MGYRYIGSKEKLASLIISYIKQICPDANSVIDLMAGTGLFSLALRKAGYRVIASDVMTYSLHHLRVLLTLEDSPSFDNVKINGRKNKNGYEGVIEFLNNITPKNGFFAREYGEGGTPKECGHSRLYFSRENARKIDAIRETIMDWNEQGMLSEIEHSLLLHDLIMAVNDVANIAGTYGHYLSHFVARALTPIKLHPYVFREKGNFKRHKVIQGYAETVSKGMKADVCYIDPPYIKRQYAANYHILETIAKEDYPDAIGDSGLRPWRNQYSNFCSKRLIRDSFAEIFKNLKCEHIFVSYSEDGLLSLDEMKALFEQFGAVTVKEIEYKRFKSNDSKKGSLLKEYIIYIHKQELK